MEGVDERENCANESIQSSYLTHIVLALTLMHDRTIGQPWGAPPSEKESFHTYNGTAMFSALLRRLPIADLDRDPLWASAALLGAITIASIDASCAEEAWPLRPSNPADLDWLRMSDGKKEVWRLVDPLREGSVWRDALAYDHHTQPEPVQGPVPELEMLYPYLTKLYDYDPLSPAAGSRDEFGEDPYHTAASILTRLLELDCNHSTIMFFLSFLGHMDPRYRELLHQKDPKALLLLAWWHGKMCQYNAWWMSRRMRLEGQAICLYLEREHGDKGDIVGLLEYPKMMTGLVG